MHPGGFVPPVVGHLDVTGEHGGEQDGGRGCAGSAGVRLAEQIRGREFCGAGADGPTALGSGESGRMRGEVTSDLACPTGRVWKDDHYDQALSKGVP